MTLGAGLVQPCHPASLDDADEPEEGEPGMGPHEFEGPLEKERIPGEDEEKLGNELWSDLAPSSGFLRPRR